MAWPESWDRQQETYMPDREHRFTTMLDVLEAVNDRLLPHLAGGTRGQGPGARAAGARVSALAPAPKIL